MNATTPERPLTERQHEIFDWICQQIETGTTPSIREIMDEFDIASPNGVIAHLDFLAKKGRLIFRGKGKSRSIRILSKNGFAVNRRGDKIGVRIDRLLTPAEAMMLSNELKIAAITISEEE